MNKLSAAHSICSTASAAHNQNMCGRYSCFSCDKPMSEQFNIYGGIDLVCMSGGSIQYADGEKRWRRDAARNGNANKVIVSDDAHAVKARARHNVIRRIRRAIRRNHMDLHYRDGEYYPVPIPGFAAVDVEQFAREVGAIRPVGLCGVCHG